MAEKGNLVDSKPISTGWEPMLKATAKPQQENWI